jgi:hypothetical protein
MSLRMLSSLVVLLAATVLAASAQPPCKRSSKRDLLVLGFPYASDGMLPARVTYMPAPDYDVESQRSQIQGTVVLFVELDENGKLKSVRPITSSGHTLKEPEKCSAGEHCPLPPRLVRSAVESVRHWRV